MAIRRRRAGFSERQPALVQRREELSVQRNRVSIPRKFAVGATANVGIDDPISCFCFNVATSNSNVATAYVSEAEVVITGVSPGFAGLTVYAADGRTAQLSVTVTQTNLNVQGAHR
jgi:hypothetical protein